MSRASGKLKEIGRIVGGVMLEMKWIVVVSVEKGRLRRASELRRKREGAANKNPCSTHNNPRLLT
jgi:hypothetical protein